jgi:hypothetical protein
MASLIGLDKEALGGRVVAMLDERIARDDTSLAQATKDAQSKERLDTTLDAVFK